MGLTGLAVRRPVTTLMCCVITLLLGGIALRQLTVDLMPEVTYPTVSVVAVYEGAGPEEVETLVTRRMEQALSGVSGVERLSSTSAEGASTIRVQLLWGTDIDAAIADMRQAVAKIRTSFPDDMDEPYIRKYDVSDSPIIYLGLLSRLPPIEVTRLAETQIMPRMERISGVARVRLRGAVRREIQVDLDRQKLEARNIAITEVTAALQRGNSIRPAGDLEQGNLHLLVRSQGEYQSLDQIRNTVIRAQGDATVRVRDVATVVDGLERRTEMTRTNGRTGMMVYIYRQAGANTIKVSDEVKLAVKELNEQLRNAELTIRVDKSDFIRQAIGNVRSSAFYGMGLAMIVLVIFLRSVRSTLVIGISMPLSILATFVLIYFKGFSLNMISFGGLALGIGLLVDNSIVVMESIYRKRADGMSPIDAAIHGTKEVASAIVASTITTLIVFLPLLFIEGMTGVLLHQMAWVVSMSLTCSLLASLTLTPVLTTLFPAEAGEDRERGLAGKGVNSFHRLNGYLLGKMESGYARVLRTSLTYKGLVGFALLAVLCASIGLYPLVGTEYMPKTDEGSIRIQTSMAAGIQLARLDESAQKIEQAILDSVQESRVFSSFIGDDAEDGEDWNRAWFRVRLASRSDRERGVEEIRNKLDEAIGPVPGMKIRVQVSNEQMVFRMLGSGNSGNLEVEIYGHEIDVAERLAAEVASTMESIKGLVNVNIEKEDRRPVISTRIDRVKASLLGISAEDITQTIETTIRGTNSTVFRESGDEFNVLVRLREEDTSRQSNVGQLGIATAAGQIIPIKSLIKVEHDNDSIAIRRQNQQRVVSVSADVEGRDLGTVVGELQSGMNALDLPRGFSMNIAGDWEEQQKSFNALIWGFVLAVLLMYMVMASQFESLKDPLLILLTIPLGAIGVMAVLIWTETTLNVQSFIGVIMLAGIVVNNAIVLIDYMNQLRRKDPDIGITDLVVEAASRRFRPIVMTTITTVLAMLPIALGLGEGGELQAPLARVVIGGLLSGTLITLIAIPAAYHARASFTATR